MAVMTEFLDLIVPITVIEEKYPGGWERCLKDHSAALNARVWFDNHLFRDGAMNHEAMKVLLDEWWKLGFVCYAEKDGVLHWKDVCVYEGMQGGTGMPCDWLAEDTLTHSVFLKGTPQGEIFGRDWDMIDDWEELKFPGNGLI
jgi:hypothetical protein